MYYDTLTRELHEDRYSSPSLPRSHNHVSIFNPSPHYLSSSSPVTAGLVPIFIPIRHSFSSSPHHPRKQILNKIFSSKNEHNFVILICTFLSKCNLCLFHNQLMFFTIGLIYSCQHQRILGYCHFKAF